MIYLSEKSIAFGTGSHGAESQWNVPEADVGALGLGYDQLEAFRLLAQFVHQIFRQIHVALHQFGETFRSLFFVIGQKIVLIQLIELIYFGSPGEPELEDVVMTSALDDLISGIVGHVVVFILLEQVISPHSIAVVQQTLSSTFNQKNYQSN